MGTWWDDLAERDKGQNSPSLDGMGWKSNKKGKGQNGKRAKMTSYYWQVQLFSALLVLNTLWILRNLYGEYWIAKFLICLYGWYKYRMEDSAPRYQCSASLSKLIPNSLREHTFLSMPHTNDSHRYVSWIMSPSVLRHLYFKHLRGFERSCTSSYWCLVLWVDWHVA